MPTTTIDLSGFAGLQPFPNLPSPGFETFYGVECCCWGEDSGDMLIVGHVGTLRALAVFRARLRRLTDRDEANYLMHDVETARESVQHLWAVTVTRCWTYPMCRSLGPTGDGHPCHDDDGGGHDAHDWSGWSDRSDDLARPVDGGLRMRWCDRCNLYETDPPRKSVNRCTTCGDIDDSGGFYLDCTATPDAPGAFPVTYWTA